MKVCFVSGEYPPMQGGVGDYTRELGRALGQLGHQIVVCTSNKTALSQQILGSNEPTSWGGGLDPAVRPIVKRWNWESWTRVLDTVHEFQSEVLHIQYQTAAYAMHPAINLLPLRLRLSPQRPRIVVTFHDLRVPYLFPKAGAARRWVNVLLARYSDAAIATNMEDLGQLQHIMLPSAPRLIPIGSNIHPLLPPGYDRSQWRSQLGIAEDETLLCYFGFLNESKGGEALFRTLAELVRRGQQVKLLMIGGQVGDSDPTNLAYLQRVKVLSSELGLTDRILWTGYTAAEVVSANFAAADICVLPYRDGVSYRRGSFMAALAHGLPIVSTQPKVPVTSLVNGENISLVPADDVAAMASAVENLIMKPALRERLGRGAKELAKEFTWDRIAAKTAELYGELLGAYSTC